jgi:hypothetical protein
MTLQRHSRSTEDVFVLKHPTRKPKERLYSDFTSDRYLSKLDAYMSQRKRFNTQDSNL